MKRLVLMASAMLAGAGFARNLNFYPYESSVWCLNGTQKVWLDADVGGSVFAAFEDGDNVSIGRGFGSITVDGLVNPGHVEIDTKGVDHSLSFTDNSYIGDKTLSIVKRGAGTFSINLVDWSKKSCGFLFSCPFVIEEGTVKVNGAGGVEPFSGGPAGLEYQVASGAMFQCMKRNTLGTSDSRISVKVADGGTFQLGPDPVDTSAYHVGNTISNLTVEGGAAVNICGLGPDATCGALNVTGTLKVENAEGNTQPFVLDYAENSETGGRWSSNVKVGLAMKGRTPTCFDVADVTDDETADLVVKIPLSSRIEAEADADAGFVKTGAGYMSITEKCDIKGDVVVREGTLGLDRRSEWAYRGYLTSTYLGDMSVTGRTITIEKDATLILRDRHLFTETGDGTEVDNGIRTETIVKGGTLSFYNQSGSVEFGPMTVHGGSVFRFEVPIATEGPFSFCGIFHVTGTEPLVIGKTPDWDPSSNNANRGDAVYLYPNNACVFDVDDVVQDGRNDFDLSLALVYPYSFDYNKWTYSKRFDYEYGFVKRGKGTMALNYAHGRVSPVLFDGTAEIEQGAILVNADYSNAGRFNVAAGAAIGGTGAISGVTLAEGAGFAAVAGQKGALTINADVALPANGILKVTLPADVDPETCGKTTVFTVADGYTLTGVENLSNWTVSVEGREGVPFTVSVTADGRGIRTGRQKGMTLQMR